MNAVLTNIVERSEIVQGSGRFKLLRSGRAGQEEEQRLGSMGMGGLNSLETRVPDQLDQPSNM